MQYRFEYADKAHMEELLVQCFALLHANMQPITQDDRPYAQQYEQWFANVYPAMQKAPRQMVLMYHGEELAGYFQYYTAGDALMMEEIQLKPQYQRSGLFGAFYTWLVGQLPQNLQQVEAYTHANNKKAQGVLAHLGLTNLPEKNDGPFLYYRGEYTALLKRFAGQ